MNNLQLRQLLKSRHSGRAYDVDRNISLAELEPLIEAAYLTPSCYNEQPWHYIITHKNETPEAYQKVLDSLVEFNQNWANRAPILIALVAKDFYKMNNKSNRLSGYDLGASAFAFTLLATDLGMMAHQMGGFVKKKNWHMHSIFLRDLDRWRSWH